MCGGHSNSKPADDESRGIAATVKGDAEAKCEKTFTTWEVESYTT